MRALVAAHCCCISRSRPCHVHVHTSVCSRVVLLSSLPRVSLLSSVTLPPSTLVCSLSTSRALMSNRIPLRYADKPIAALPAPNMISGTGAAIMQQVTTQHDRCNTTEAHTHARPYRVCICWRLVSHVLVVCCAVPCCASVLCSVKFVSSKRLHVWCSQRRTTREWTKGAERRGQRMRVLERMLLSHACHVDDVMFCDAMFSDVMCPRGALQSRSRRSVVSLHAVATAVTVCACDKPHRQCECEAVVLFVPVRCCCCCSPRMDVHAMLMRWECDAMGCNAMRNARQGDWMT